MIAVGITSGHVLLADWLFLIAAVLMVIIAIVANSPRAVPNSRGFAVQCVAIALIAVGLMVL